MIYFYKKLKNKNSKFNQGMTYAELIVVIAIFGIMSAVTLTNNKNFEKKVSIRNLANDVALKIVQAQKDAMSGLNSVNFFGVDPNTNEMIKPSYGLNFKNGDTKFIYFADTDNNGIYNDSDIFLNSTAITKGNSISQLLVISGTNCPSEPSTLNVVFKRPDSGARITTEDDLGCVISEAQIAVSASDPSINSKIDVFSSGRIQIN